MHTGCVLRQHAAAAAVDDSVDEPWTGTAPTTPLHAGYDDEYDASGSCPVDWKTNAAAAAAGAAYNCCCCYFASQFWLAAGVAATSVTIPCSYKS